MLPREGRISASTGMIIQAPQKTKELRIPDLRMQWMDAEQGKSRAMNLALYNSEGKYTSQTVSVLYIRDFKREDFRNAENAPERV